MLSKCVLGRLHWPVSRGSCRKLCRQQSTSNALLPQAREKLASLGEGQVSLVKDETSGIATITLQHERRKNAISGRMMVQLADITEELQNWSAGKAVILCGEGEVFCSGGDLTTKKHMSSPHDGLLISTLMSNATLRLYRLPFVTVCLVHGKAIGGGAELVTATDYRVFTETGEVGFVQGRMGLATAFGGGPRLVKMLGSSTALKALLTCKTFSASEAMKIGLADHVIDSKNRQEELTVWLSSLIAHEPEVVQGMKKVVVGARDSLLNDSMLNETLNVPSLWGGPANVKALGKNIKHN